MPSLVGFTWSDALDAIIREESRNAGVPLDLSYTFIGAESSFNPNVHVVSAIEDSVGLLELNRRGGQGAGYSVAELLDPRRNLQIGLPYIRRAFEAAWRPNVPPLEFIYQVSIRSGHPGQVPITDTRIVRITNIWASFYPAAGLSLQGPGPATGPGHAPAPVLAAALAIPFEIAAAPLLLSALFPSLMQAAFGAGNLNELVNLTRMTDPEAVVSRLVRRELGTVQGGLGSPRRRRFGHRRR